MFPTPLHDRLILEPIEDEKISPGGIILSAVTKENSCKAKVVAVGTGKVLEDGSVQMPNVKVGDTIMYAKYSAMELTINKTKYLVMKEDDLMGIL